MWHKDSLRFLLEGQYVKRPHKIPCKLQEEVKCHLSPSTFILFAIRNVLLVIQAL